MAGDLENHSKVRRRREKGKGTGQTDMDLRNKWRTGVEDDETNLGMVTVSVGDAGDNRKRSPNVHRKSSPERDPKLRRSIYGATSGGSEKGSYF